MKTVILRKSRIVTKSGGACHIYLPDELEGKDVVGLILRDGDTNDIS